MTHFKLASVVFVGLAFMSVACGDDDETTGSGGAGGTGGSSATGGAAGSGTGGSAGTTSTGGTGATGTGGTATGGTAGTGTGGGGAGGTAGSGTGGTAGTGTGGTAGSGTGGTAGSGTGGTAGTGSGFDCASYCTCMSTNCASQAIPGGATCMAFCEGGSSQGQTCWAQHCGFAASDPVTHCPHAVGLAICPAN